MFDVLGDLFAELFAGVIEAVRGRKVYRVALFENRSGRRVLLAGYGRRNLSGGDKTPVVSYKSGRVVTAAVARKQLADDLGGEWSFVAMEPFDGQQYLRCVDKNEIQDAETYELHKQLERDESTST